MAGRQYERLPIDKFGSHLLESGDLDPVYIALNKMELPEPQLHRWLIAYWCLYHCGAASYISEAEGVKFWERMKDAAENTQPTPLGGRWPRGHERRHFRGEAAVKAVTKLWGRYFDKPEELVQYVGHGLVAGSPVPFEQVAQRAKEHPLFGPWIAFKIADMIDRVLQAPVDFSEAAVFMFDDPVKAALMLWRQHEGLPETARPKDQAVVIHNVVEHLKKVFKGYEAPPLYDRPVGIQEIETILCKWKSHMNGHYPLNNDIDEIQLGLVGWTARSKTAHALSKCMPARM